MGLWASKLDLYPPHYPRFGVSHDLAYLKSLQPGIIWRPREQQAKVADAITRRYAGNAAFCLQTSQRLQPTMGEAWNSTSIGNMAYLAQHSHPDFRCVYTAYYDEMIRQLTTRHACELDADEKQALRSKVISDPFPEVAAFG